MEEDEITGIHFQQSPPVPIMSSTPVIPNKWNSNNPPKPWSGSLKSFSSENESGSDSTTGTKGSLLKKDSASSSSFNLTEAQERMNIGLWNAAKGGKKEETATKTNNYTQENVNEMMVHNQNLNSESQVLSQDSSISFTGNKEQYFYSSSNSADENLKSTESESQSLPDASNKLRNEIKNTGCGSGSPHAKIKHSRIARGIFIDALMNNIEHSPAYDILENNISQSSLLQDVNEFRSSESLSMKQTDTENAQIDNKNGDISVNRSPTLMSGVPKINEEGFKTIELKKRNLGKDVSFPNHSNVRIFYSELYSNNAMYLTDEIPKDAYTKTYPKSDISERLKNSMTCDIPLPHQGSLDQEIRNELKSGLSTEESNTSNLDFQRKECNFKKPSNCCCSSCKLTAVDTEDVNEFVSETIEHNILANANMQENTEIESSMNNQESPQVSCESEISESINIDDYLPKEIYKLLKSKRFVDGATMTEILKYLQTKSPFTKIQNLKQVLKAYLTYAECACILTVRKRRYLLSETSGLNTRKQLTTEINKEMKLLDSNLNSKTDKNIQISNPVEKEHGINISKDEPRELQHKKSKREISPEDDEELRSTKFFKSL